MYLQENILVYISVNSPVCSWRDGGGGDHSMEYLMGIQNPGREAKGESMQWGVYQANDEQKHTIIFLQCGRKTTDMRAITIRFQFELHTYYPWKFFN